METTGLPCGLGIGAVRGGTYRPDMADDERAPDASDDVMRMIALAAHPPTTNEIVDGLKAKHSEESRAQRARTLAQGNRRRAGRG